MAGFVCIGALAAFGLVCVLWLIYGMCCGKPEGTLLIISRGGPGIVRRCLWLREMGLLRCSMVLLEPELDPIEAAWLERHGIRAQKPMARNAGEEKYGAGTGDSSGCHQCGGVSEL